jgi:NifU-like protein involved in Fe-S cluster formation
MSAAGGSALYSLDLLRLTTVLAEFPPLTAADVHTERRSPVCGSVVAVTARFEQDRLTALGLNVRACAVGQASAAILARHGIGRTMAEIETVRAQLTAFLAGDAEGPGEWPEIDKLVAVREFPARHAAAILPWDTLISANAERRAVHRSAAG